MATECQDCDNVVEHTRKKHPAQWLCIKFPRRNGFGFVTSTWMEEPYMRCVGINGGACPMHEALRDKQEQEIKQVHRSDFKQSDAPHAV